MRRLMLCLACLLLPVLGGCGTAYRAAVDERDLGTFVDDGRIESSVRARIINDDLVLLRDLSVNSYLGTVYLVGEFDSDRQKLRAVKLAREVSGVRRVSVVPFEKRDDPDCGTTDNLALYARIKAALVEDTTIWSTQVDVKTVQCNAVILGLVASQRDADKIVRHVNEAEGVRSVQNLLRIVR
jgi:hyperosmotically inducible periplasmic protein